VFILLCGSYGWHKEEVFLLFQTRSLFKGLSRHLFESGHYRKSGIVFGSHMNNSSCLFMPH